MGERININFNNKPYRNNFKIEAKKVGMNEYLYSSLCYELQNKISVFDKKSFSSLESELICKVVNPSFLEKSIKILDILKKYGTYVLTSNGIKGKISGKYNYCAEIQINDESVGIVTNTQDVSTKDVYTKDKDTYQIYNQEIIRKKIIYMDRNEIANNNTSKERTSVFDYDNVEKSRKEVTNHSNNIYNKDTMTYTIPDTLDRENTKEIKEYYRRGNKVLHSYELIFLNKDYKYENGEFKFNKDLINKEEYYIADNFRLDDKLIPKMLFFERIDYGRYLELKDKKEENSKKLFKKRK